VRAPVDTAAAAPSSPQVADAPAAQTVRASWSPSRRILAAAATLALVLLAVWAVTDGHRTDDDRALPPKALSDALKPEAALNASLQQQRGGWIAGVDETDNARKVTAVEAQVRAAATTFRRLARQTSGGERRALATIASGLTREAGALDRSATAPGLTLGLAAGCDAGWSTAQMELRAGRGAIARAFDEPLLSVTPADEATERLGQLTLCAVAVRTALIAPITPPLTMALATRSINAAANDLKRRADGAPADAPATTRLRQRVGSAAGHELRILELLAGLQAGTVKPKDADAQIKGAFTAADDDIAAAFAVLR
jgi:hypothetical protein